MADRKVTATGKDSDGDITKLCNSSEDWSPVSKNTAIGDIESERHSYYVNRAGYRTDVHVVDDPDGKYLRTDADPSSDNNLDNLPDC